MSDNFIKSFYREVCDEDSRLLSRDGNIEFVTTMEYIHRYLSDNKSAKILEVGAGTGRYSIAMADEGYEVCSIEFVDENLDILKSKIKPEHNIVAEQGNALDLSRYEDGSFDMTLVLGPMYHLFTLEDKRKALREAIRVTKKDGIIMVAYCMNEATVIQYLFGERHSVDYYNRGKVTEDFKCKSIPEDIFDLMRSEDIDEVNRGLNMKREKLIATDGAAGYIKDLLYELSEEEYELFVKYHLKTCERQDLIGASNHSLDILRKI